MDEEEFQIINTERHDLSISSGIHKVASQFQELPTKLTRSTYSNIEHSHVSSSSFVGSDKESLEGRMTRGLSLIDENNQIFQSIEFSPLVVWLILLVNAISNSAVPCWMTVDVQSQGITRSSWRIFMMTVLLIPFVQYEQRTASPKQKFSALLQRDNLQKLFICSINYCVWVLFGVMATKLTARAHSFCFLRLKFYFIAIGHVLKREKYHQAEMAGVLLVSVGITMGIWDSLKLPVGEADLAYYLSNSPLQRLLGDCLSICGSLALLFLQSRYELPKTPRFSTLFLYNCCIVINLLIFGYFFGGNQFSFDPHRGVLGLFTEENFVSVFYVSVMLGLNLMLGNILVDRLFSDFIRNVASCFEIVFTASAYHLFQIQVLPSGLTALGFAFLVPGMMLIVGGQNYLQNKQFRVNLELYRQEQQAIRPSEIVKLLASCNPVLMKSAITESNSPKRKYKPQ